MVRDIDDWAASPALTALVAASGGRIGGATGQERLTRLAEFSVRWDARTRQERDQATVVAVSPAVERLVVESARELGQTGHHAPSRDRYDVVLMTAGMVRAQVVKPRFVTELLAGGLRVREVVFLGAFRPFSPAELQLGAALGLTATDEVDSMIEGMEREFGPLGEAVSDGVGQGPSGWLDCSWQRDALRLRVIAAPSSVPPRRANTADTFRFWAERHATSVTRVLATTTPIYVPYQATVAVDVLGRGFDLAVETVGATATSLDLGACSQPFLAQHHLQELRSAILAMCSLRAALTSGSQ